MITSARWIANRERRCTGFPTMAIGVSRATDAIVPTVMGTAGAPTRLSIVRAPLVPFAFAVTAGIVLDRYASIPLPTSLVVAVFGILTWAIMFFGGKPEVAVVYLGISAAALGAGYHHGYLHVYAADDIGEFVTADARPAKLRGVLEEEPRIQWLPAELKESLAPSPRALEDERNIQSRPRQNPLQSIPPRLDLNLAEPTVAVIRVSRLRRADDQLAVSGRARLIVTGHLPSRLYVGDEIEVVGRFLTPHGPANPGEFDYASHLLDQRIRAELVVKTPDGVKCLARGWHWSWAGWLAILRGWAQWTLDRAMPQESVLSTALLLGESFSIYPDPMTNEDWDRYKRTGVIHVLAISGQHLMMLAFFLWYLIRLLGIPRSRAAWFVALFLLGYSLLTGGRPPVMRSAVMVCVYCGALILRRRVLLPNSFALAWLIVALLNPTDIFDAGCQLSFLSVAVLYWYTDRWFGNNTSLERPVEERRTIWQRILLHFANGSLEPPINERRPFLQLMARMLLQFANGPLDECRPFGQKIFLHLVRETWLSYKVTFVIWLSLLPLVASRCQVIPLVGLVIGPPVVLLTSIALIAGFLLLLAAVVWAPAAVLFGWVVGWCLTRCDRLVHISDVFPGSYWYVGTVPDWWLWLLYPGLLVFLTLEPLRQRWRWAALAGLAWLGISLLSEAITLATGELRCTFLAVGHGGCTVLETPDGRTLLYDAGALGGPDVARRQIAPYLWYRGIRRIDHVFLSHADLDHFNGICALLDRFAVGSVIFTPTFVNKRAPGVQLTLAALERHHVPTRVVRAGHRLQAGEVQFEVLHPPAVGPEGIENARSMVLLVRHARHTFLLTGDLEGPGLARVLSLAPVHIDVLMAPHHGSRFANTAELAQWAQPTLVVSCEGPPRGPVRPPEPYTPMGARFLGTWPHGAVTVRSHASGLVVETFQTKYRFVIRPNRAP